MIERIILENFKSFVGKHEIELSSRLNCITGPNGSGKSNLLEAIYFALGEGNSTRLRIQSIKDLMSSKVLQQQLPTRRGSGPNTSVTLILRTKKKDQVELNASICPHTNHRKYRWNKKLVPIKQIKRYLRLLCGINMDITLWIIQQNLVHKMPSKSPQELASYLCEAGGTKSFFEHKSEAEEAMIEFKHLASKIQENIDHLSSIIEHDKTILADQRLIRQTLMRIKKIEKKRQDLKSEQVLTDLHLIKEEADLLDKIQGQLQAQMSTIREEMERKKYHLLQEQVACSDPNQLENKLEEKETMFLTLKTRLEILLNKLQTNSTLLETKQKEKEQQMEKQQTKTLEEIDQIQTQIQDIYGFLYALDFLSNTNMKKEEINKQIQQELNQEEQINSFEKALESHFQLQAHFENEIQKCQEKITELNASYDETFALEIDSSINTGSTSPFSMEQLQRKIFSMESQTIELSKKLLQSRAHILRRPDGKLFPPIQQDTNVKDFGLLMDLVTFEEEEEEQQFLIWKNALSMILEKHLLHRICLDQEMALQILKANGNKQSLTIWPLKSLQINANKRPLDRVFPIIEKELGSKNVKDPLSLVKMNTLYHQHHTLLSKCLFKALGSWLLVKDDTIGKQVLKQYGIPCISRDTLNLHSPGLLTGGQKYLRSNNEDNSLFESVLKYKSMSKKLSMIQSNLKETKKQLESVQESQAKAQLRLDLKLRLDKWKNERIEYETRLEQVKSDIESSKKELKQFKFLHKRKDLTQKHLNKLWEKQSLDSLDVEREKSKALEQKKQLETKFDELQDLQVCLNAQAKSLKKERNELIEEISMNKRQEKLLKKEIASCQQVLEEMRAKWTCFQEKQSQMEALSQEINQLKLSRKQLSLQMEENTSKEKQIHQELFEVEKKMKQMDISYVNSSHFRDKELILSDLKTNEIQLRDLRRSNEVIEAKLVSKGMIDEEFVLSKQSKLNLFNDQLLKIQQAIKNLEDGLLSTQKRAHEANLLAFSHIQKHFQKIFKQVVPRKKAFLQLSDQEKAYVEQGVYFDVRNDDTLMTNNNSSKATKELSGGQLTMLSMSYVFALACFSASPLYMLDEIDAALDEHNQQVLGNVLAQVFDQSQVICISHHVALQNKAHMLLQVQKIDGSSQVKVKSQRRQAYDRTKEKANI